MNRCSLAETLSLSICEMRLSMAGVLVNPTGLSCVGALFDYHLVILERRERGA